MSDKNIGEGVKGRRIDPSYTREVEQWRDSIARRDRVYAVSYRLAIDGGRSPEEARAIAREAFLRSFESAPEVMFVVNLDSKHIED